MKGKIEKVKKMGNKAMEKVMMAKIVRDQKGGPGLEEAVLLLFIGLVIAKSADSLGVVVESVFNKATDSIKTALGIS